MYMYKGEWIKPGDVIPVDVYQHGIWDGETSTFYAKYTTTLNLEVAKLGKLGSTTHVKHLGRTWPLAHEAVDRFAITI